MIAYFVRASLDPADDIDRGFSAVGNYVFSFSRDEEVAAQQAADEGQDFDDLAWHEHLRGWVLPRAGLCAHDYFESLEEAIEAVRAGNVQFVADAGMRDMAEIYIFEGEHTFESSMDDGVTFHPTGKYWEAK